MEGSRMVLPIEMDVIKLMARVNELESQAEVMKGAIRWLIFKEGVFDYEELAMLKTLVKPALPIEEMEFEEE